MKTTKKGDAMCVLQLEDSESSIDVVMFPNMWQERKEVVKKNMVCVITGKIDDRGQLLADDIIPIDGLELRAQKYVKLTLNVSGSEELDMKKFLQALGRCKGKARVILELCNDEEAMTMCLNNYSVDPDKLNDALMGIFPAGIYEVHSEAKTFAA